MSSTGTEVLEKDGTLAKSDTPLVVLIDWDGRDDPGNPKNWSFGTKVYATAVPALFAFVVCGYPLKYKRFAADNA